MDLADVGALFAGPWGPLIIFVLRIVDVSLSTVRMLLMMRNARLLVPAIAFVEVLVWVFAVGNAIKNIESAGHLAGYAFGFSLGTVVGMWLEEKLAYGYATVRMMSRRQGVGLSGLLRERGFGVTEFEGFGRDGPIRVLVSTVRRRDLRGLLAAAQAADPQVFATVEEARSMRRGWLMQERRK